MERPHLPIGSGYASFLRNRYKLERQRAESAQRELLRPNEPHRLDESYTLDDLPGHIFHHCSTVSVSDSLNNVLKSRDRHIIPLRHLKYSSFGTSCSFCRLALACYTELSSRGDFQYVLSLSFPEPTATQVLSTEDYMAEAQITILAKLSPLVEAPNFEMSFIPGARYDLKAFRELKIAGPIEPLSTRISGRRFQPLANIETLCSWLRTCEENHSERYHMWRSSSGVPEPVEGMNLIDVRRRCVSRAAPNSRYFALSYVWGPANLQSFQALKSKFHQSEDQLWEMALPPKLPNTIEDAMHVVQAMGEQFLWVDSLCIVQDDQKSRDLQIAQMYMIYNNAILTIVASSGSNVDAGLPGWKQDSRRIQATELVQGIELVPALPSVNNCIRSSIWNTRGWTLQERFFSRRLLIFDTQQVYFQCASGTWCEDMRGRDTMDGRQHLFFTYTMQGLQITGEKFLLHPSFSNLTLGPYQMPGMEGLHIGYSTILRHYTSTKLTNSSDILRAVVGIARAMELKWGTFVCGLPEEAFDWAILWQQWSPLVRRRAFDTGSQSTGRFFPTWSWAGWHGGVYNLNDLDFRRARSRIIWHPSEVDSTTPVQRPFVSDAAFYSTAIHQPSLVKKSKRSPTVVMDRITELGLESGVLKFWASCAVFRLCRETSNQGYNWHTTPGGKVAAYSVYGRQGAWIGQAVLHEVSDDLPLSVDPHHLTFHKFICLSQAVRFQQVSCHAPGRLRFFEYRDDDIDEEELAKMSEGGSGDRFASKEPTHNWLGATKWNWFNVLIVRPSHELPRDNPPSYLRAGFGMIRRTAWKAAKPEWRLIHLR